VIVKPAVRVGAIAAISKAMNASPTQAEKSLAASATI
jgi:hypothetical protein